MKANLHWGVAGVAAHDALFVLLRPGVAEPSRAVHERRITGRNKTNKESCAATPGNSSVKIVLNN